MAHHQVLITLLVTVLCVETATAEAQTAARLIEAAIEISPEVLKSKAQLRVSQADEDIVKARWRPQVDARLYQGDVDTQQSNPFVANNSRQDAIKNNSLSVQQALYNAPLRIQLEQARIAKEAAALRLIQANQSAIQTVLLALVNYKQAQASSLLAKAQAETLRASQEQISQAIRSGESSPLELSVVCAEHELKIAELDEALLNQQQRLDELTGITGLAIDSNELDSMTLVAPAMLPEEQLNLENPELNSLAALLQTLEVANARLEIDKATAGHHPSLKLVAQNNQSQSDSVSTLGNRVNQKVLALQMDIPLFAGGGVQAQEEKARANLLVQQAQLDRIYLQSKIEAQSARKQLNSALRLIPAIAKALEAAQQQTLALRAAINHSLNTPLDLLRHNEKVAELKIKHQDKLISAIKSYVTLLSLTGKATAAQASTLLIEPVAISDSPLKRF